MDVERKLQELEIKLLDFLNARFSRVAGAASIVVSGLCKEVKVGGLNDFLEVCRDSNVK